jgi:hypothetical protein
MNTSNQPIECVRSGCRRPAAYLMFHGGQLTFCHGHQLQRTLTFDVNALPTIEEWVRRRGCL